MSEVTQDRLKELFTYSPDTGEFTRARTIGNSPSQKKGYVAGTVNVAGYKLISIGRKVYKAHRLAWLYMNGEWPSHHIDHLNRNKADNRIDNLRDVTCAVNLQNQRSAHANNCSGFIGVHWHGASTGWAAQITTNGKKQHLGIFKTPQLAADAYQAAKRAQHAECPQ